VFKHIPIIPGKTFTIGVIAAMPLMATTAKAATATAYLTKSSSGDAGTIPCGINLGVNASTEYRISHYSVETPPLAVLLAAIFLMGVIKDLRGRLIRVDFLKVFTDGLRAGTIPEWSDPMLWL
jgi:hypothetical protein